MAPRTAKPKLTGDTRRQIRAYLADRDGRTCHYCARPFAPDLSDATLDHYVPYCLWAMNRPRNLVLACNPCNNAKADHLPPTLAFLLCAHHAPSQPPVNIEPFTVNGDARPVNIGPFTVNAADVMNASTVNAMNAVNNRSVHPTSTPVVNAADSTGRPTGRVPLRLVGSGGGRVDALDFHPTSTLAPAPAALAVVRLLARLAHALLSTPDRGGRSTPDQPVHLDSTPDRSTRPEPPTAEGTAA